MNDEVRKELDAMLGVLEGSTNSDDLDSDDENLEEIQDDKIIEEQEPGDDEKGEIEETKKTEEIIEEDLETKDETKDDTTEETEQTISDTERYRKENEELRKRIDELSTPKEPEEKVEEPKEQTLESINFVGDIDEDDFYDIVRNPAKFNELLNKVYSQGVKISQEGVLRGIPDIVKNNVTTVIALRKASDEFYENNEDLAPFKKVVAAVFEEIASEHPDWKYDKVLEQSGIDARTRLELIKKTNNQNQDKDKDKKNNKPNLPRKRGQQRQTQNKPDTDPLLLEIDEMNKVVT
uniref:Uncharacterized protein n=1 Tax=viral metagenome TaxID=1070528 RepID=A0A6M3IIS0_9ZZZZ